MSKHIMHTRLKRIQNTKDTTSPTFVDVKVQWLIFNTDFRVSSLGFVGSEIRSRQQSAYGARTSCAKFGFKRSGANVFGGAWMGIQSNIMKKNPYRCNLSWHNLDELSYQRILFGRNFNDSPIIVGRFRGILVNKVSYSCIICVHIHTYILHIHILVESSSFHVVQVYVVIGLCAVHGIETLECLTRASLVATSLQVQFALMCVLSLCKRSEEKSCLYTSITQCTRSLLIAMLTITRMTQRHSDAMMY